MDHTADGSETREALVAAGRPSLIYCRDTFGRTIISAGSPPRRWRGLVAVLAVMAVVSALTALQRVGAVPLASLAASPREVADGRLWLLVTSGAIAADPLLWSLLSFYALAFLTHSAGHGSCGSQPSSVRRSRRCSAIRSSVWRDSSIPERSTSSCRPLITDSRRSRPPGWVRSLRSGGGRVAKASAGRRLCSAVSPSPAWPG